MKNCPECGNKNLNSSISCQECGSSLENSEQTLNQYNSDKALIDIDMANQLKSLYEKISQIEFNTRNRSSISISDVNMTFKSMVIFMIKWAAATIPAAIILLLLALIFTALFRGIFSTLFH